MITINTDGVSATRECRPHALCLTPQDTARAPFPAFYCSDPTLCHSQPNPSEFPTASVQSPGSSATQLPWEDLAKKTKPAVEKDAQCLEPPAPGFPREASHLPLAPGTFPHTQLSGQYKGQKPCKCCPSESLFPSNSPAGPRQVLS